MQKNIYIGETDRRLGDRFREHHKGVAINDKDASKPVARHFNLPNYSQKHMVVCGLSLHLGNSIFHYYSLVHSDEGLALETSVFESFTD